MQYYYVPYQNTPFRSEVNTQILGDVQKAINAEYSAISCYGKLANMAPTQFEKDRILEIQSDEKRHLGEFSRIYSNLTGEQPTYQITKSCPNTYMAGIDFAFKDEQNSVDFYLDIADKTQDQYIKERFNRAAKDEQHHAVWFLYFLQTN